MQEGMLDFGESQLHYTGDRKRAGVFHQQVHRSVEHEKGNSHG